MMPAHDRSRLCELLPALGCDATGDLCFGAFHAGLGAEWPLHEDLAGLTEVIGGSESFGLDPGFHSSLLRASRQVQGIPAL
jgi:hypothetical protein